MKNSSQLRRTGFTLVELLVVISIIVVLTSVSVPVVGKVTQRAAKLQAKNACTGLVTAVDSYYNAYNLLPANSRTAPSEDTVLKTTEPIMAILSGFNEDGMNRKEQVFFSGDAAKGGSKESARNGLWQDSEGAALYSPWSQKPGKQRGYSLLLDYDYNEKLNDPFRDNRVIARRAVAWSAGKDGVWTPSKPKQGRNKDNVYSWF